MIEVKVRVRNEETSLAQKFLPNETDIKLSRDDSTLLSMVEEVIGKFKGPIDDVDLTIKMVW